MRRIVGIGLAAALAMIMALAAAGVAQGARQQVPTRLTIKLESEDSFVFKGRAKSRVGRCERRRTVRLFREGEDTGMGPVFMEEGMTNERGRYAIDVGGLLPVDNYFTRVGPKKVKGARCKGDESRHLDGSA